MTFIRLWMQMRYTLRQIPKVFILLTAVMVLCKILLFDVADDVAIGVYIGGLITIVYQASNLFKSKG